MTLRRLTEDLELELAVMRFLEESGLMPGAEIVVDGIGPDGSMSLTVAGRSAALGAELADNLWVEPAPAEPSASDPGHSFGAERP